MEPAYKKPEVANLMKVRSYVENAAAIVHEAETKDLGHIGLSGNSCNSSHSSGSSCRTVPSPLEAELE